MLPVKGVIQTGERVIRSGEGASVTSREREQSETLATRANILRRGVIRADQDF